MYSIIIYIKKIKRILNIFLFYFNLNISLEHILIFLVEETKFQKGLKIFKYFFNHLLNHPFIDLAILGISYRIIYFILKITGFL